MSSREKRDCWVDVLSLSLTITASAMKLYTQCSGLELQSSLLLSICPPKQLQKLRRGKLWGSMVGVTAMVGRRPLTVILSAWVRSAEWSLALKGKGKDSLIVSKSKISRSLSRSSLHETCGILVQVLDGKNWRFT